MKKTIWALFDDRMGSIGQAKGILQELGNDFEIIEKKIVYNKLAALPNMILGKTLFSLNRKQSSPLKEPFPDVVLSISRRTAPIALWIKKRSKGKTKVVQLMFPGKYGLQDFDLVAISEHDRGKSDSPNLFYITGCPHRINSKTITEAKEKWEPVFKDLPKPWTAVIIGGSVKKSLFTAKDAEKFAEAVLYIHNQVSGSLFITSSRRTGKEAEDVIMKKIEHIPAYTYLWGEEKENPIMGFYACADKIIATGDSVSMVCESCGTGKPVIIFSGKWMPKKHHRFVKSLIDGGYAVDIKNQKAIDFAPSQCLNPSEIIAGKIKEL